MACLETLYTKDVTNEINFLLITHMTYSDARFDSYRIFEARTGC
jgi:hypothetical protein